MRRGGVEIDSTVILGEADGRLQRPERDCEELHRVGILKGRPGGRFGLALGPGDDAGLEIFPSWVGVDGQLGERRIFE